MFKFTPKEHNLDLLEIAAKENLLRLLTDTGASGKRLNALREEIKMLKNNKTAQGDLEES